MLTSLLNKQERKVIFLASLGGALEFYDFVIYMFFAHVLSQIFFPQKNHFASLMEIFAVFAIGYLIRPLGGIVFGHFGDIAGRKKTFIASVLLMAIPTFLIGLLPTHSSFAMAPAALLVLLRVMQGLAVGGEIPGAVTFTSEHVSPGFRGLACGIIFFGLNMGMILGSAISLLLYATCSEQTLLAWGWRIPFLLGGMLGIVSYYLRKQMVETPIFLSNQAKHHQEKIPVIYVVRYHLRALFQGIALTGLGAVVVCLLFLYMPTYLTNVFNYPKTVIAYLNTINLILFSITLIGTGWLSDHIGRRKVLLIGSGGFIIFGYFLFFLLSQPHLIYVICALLCFALLGACISGVYPCTITELFPTSVRYTGMAIAYNLGFGIFGGLSPLLATYLIQITHDKLAPSFYLILSAVMCFLVSLTLSKDVRAKAF